MESNKDIREVEQETESVEQETETREKPKDDIILCRYCGKELKKGMLFCIYCGEATADPSGETEESD